MAKQPISADSHITEPPNCYKDYIDPKYRDEAPGVVAHETLGDIYVIPGLDTPIPLSLVAAAGKDPSELSTKGGVFDELHRGGWDPKAREADQDRDGVIAEIIYPSVGMMLCNHPDFTYKRACFDAYNRWLQEFCDGLPNRLFGMPQIAMASPEEGIEEVRKAKEMGFKGVMLVGVPGHEDYHHPDYDPFYEAVVDMDMPLSFHILTSRKDALKDYRGPKINSFLTDVCESVIAALYLDGGLSTAARFIRRHWQVPMERSDKPPLDSKTALQEWAQGRGMPLPSYRIANREGPDHAPTFTIAVSVADGPEAVGNGSTRRAAEQAAAGALLKMVQADG